MYLKLSEAGGLEFEDRHNFRAFKLAVAADHSGLDDTRHAVAGKAELADADTAWIFEDTLRRCRASITTTSRGGRICRP